MGEARRGTDFPADTVIVSEGEAIQSIHPTGISSVVMPCSDATSIKNISYQLTASPTHTSSQSSFLACSFCKVRDDENNSALLPTGEGVRSTDEGADSYLFPSGINPSPENLLFASAQSDFLPSPVGRGGIQSL